VPRLNADHRQARFGENAVKPLHVSVKETSVCIVDDTGKIVRETRVASEPEVLTNTIYRRPESEKRSKDWGNRPASLWIAKD
jgi:hypothetical protein